MMTSIPFQKTSVPDKRQERKRFSPPDMGRVPFQNVDLDFLHSSNNDEECNESTAELMAQAAYLDDLDQAEEVEVEANCEDTIEDDPLQTPVSDVLPVSQQDPTALSSPESETESMPDTSCVADTARLETLKIPSVPSPPELTADVIPENLPSKPHSHSESVSRAINYQNTYGGEGITRITSDAIAQKVISRIRAINIKGVLYAYTAPIYRKLTPDLIKGLVLKYCNYDLAKTQNDSLLNLIYTYIRARMSLAECSLEENPQYVVFKECRYDLEERRFEPNGPDICAFSYVNVCITEATDSHPWFDAFLDRATGGDTCLQYLIWEMIGYIISADMSAKKFFVLKGESDTGKSLMIRILRALFQQDITERVIPLHSLGDRFALGGLSGVRLVTDDDYAGGCLSEASIATIKSITGGDSVRAEMKGQGAVTITPCSKLVVASNFIPVSKIDDPAFSKRQLVIPFNNVIPEDEQDPELFDKIKGELPSIARTALGYLSRLRDNRFKFTQVNWAPCVSSAEEQLIALPVRTESSSDKLVQDFVESFCSLDENSITLTQDLFKVFEGFCKDRGQHTLDIKDFSSRLGRIYPELSKKKRGSKNGYLGISLKSQGN